MRTEFASLGLGFSALALAAYGLTRAPARAASTTASGTDSIAVVVRGVALNPSATAGARDAFLRLHEDEIRKTFVVAEIVPGDTLALALVRYSIGGAVFHDARWVRRIDGQWYPSSPPPADIVTERTDTGFRLQTERSVRWLQEGAPRWW
jgi:hypothetical protein